MTFLVNIIGAGHLGKTIGRLLVKRASVTIKSICNQSEESTASAIQFIGQGEYCQAIKELPAADITFITTPDDLISTCCKTLSTNLSLKKGSIVLHCSGSLTSDTLSPIKGIGCYVASIHPMRSFVKPELSVEAFNGTYCAIEGDIEAIQIIQPLFNAIGAITYTIDKSKKCLYHAAGIFASNYLITLAEKALSCMSEAGVETDMAMHIITNIMQGTVLNLEQTLSPEQSLTGPIQRGDISTIMEHMDSLIDTEKKYLYSMLGKATISLTKHPHEKKEEINSALTITIKEGEMRPHNISVQDEI